MFDNVVIVAVFFEYDYSVLQMHNFPFEDYFIRSFNQYVAPIYQTFKLLYCSFRLQKFLILFWIYWLQIKFDIFKLFYIYLEVIFHSFGQFINHSFKFIGSSGCQRNDIFAVWKFEIYVYFQGFVILFLPYLIIALQSSSFISAKFLRITIVLF